MDDEAGIGSDVDSDMSVRKRTRDVATSSNNSAGDDENDDDGTNNNDSQETSFNGFFVDEDSQTGSRASAELHSHRRLYTFKEMLQETSNADSFRFNIPVHEDVSNRSRFTHRPRMMRDSAATMESLSMSSLSPSSSPSQTTIPPFCVPIARFIQLVKLTAQNPHVIVDKNEFYKTVVEYTSSLYDTISIDHQSVIWLHVVQLAIGCDMWTDRTPSVFNKDIRRFDFRYLLKKDVEKWFQCFTHSVETMKFVKRALFTDTDENDVRMSQDLEYVLVSCEQQGKRLSDLMEMLFPVSFNEQISMYQSSNDVFQAIASKQLFTDATGETGLEKFLRMVALNLKAMEARVRDDFVYVPVYHDGHRTFAFEKRDTIENTIRGMYSFHHNLEMTKLSMSSQNIVTFAADYVKKQVQTLYYPPYNPHRSQWSFPGCVYMGFEDEFCFYGAPNFPANACTSQFINQNIDALFHDDGTCKYDTTNFLDIPTPYVNQIIHFQFRARVNFPTEEEIRVEKFFWGIIGRLFFKVGTDNYQVLPFLIGSAGTGKSLLLSLIRSVYEPSLVGHLQVDIQEKFGLESIMDKILITVSEVSKKKGISQQLVQSMVSGEAVSVNQKNKKTITIDQFEASQIWAMNEYPGWQDKSGSLGRRILSFRMPNIPTPDDQLKTNLSTDLAMFIIKACKAYKWLREEAARSRFANIIPETLKSYTREMVQELNPLAAFFNKQELVSYDDHQNIVLESELRSAIQTFASVERIRIEYERTNVDSFLGSMGVRIIPKYQTACPRTGAPMTTRAFQGITLLR